MEEETSIPRTWQEVIEDAKRNHNPRLKVRGGKREIGQLAPLLYDPYSSLCYRYVAYGEGPSTSSIHPSFHLCFIWSFLLLVCMACDIMVGLGCL